MSDPSKDPDTFDKIAGYVSRANECSEDLISNLLVSDLWDGEFSPEKLFWNEYNARLVLDPGELPDDIPPSLDDFQETSREELYGLLSIVGEPLASDRANFPRLAQFELNQYSANSQVILMNVAIPADKVRLFYDRHGLKRPTVYERALKPETQPQNRPQSEALATSNALPTRTQSETAKLRKRLTKWIEEFAVTDEAKGLVKADFFELALKGVDPRIPYYMFREAWSAAEIPEDFTKPGVRLKRTPE